MANEITVSTLGDAVRERVKKAIFDSIPEAAIEKLIQNELNNMTSQTREVYIDGSYKRISPLQEVISMEIRKQLSERAFIYESR